MLDIGHFNSYNYNCYKYNQLALQRKCPLQQARDKGKIPCVFFHTQK